MVRLLSQSPYRQAAGFTLLELLVALSIFGLLAAMAYGGLNSVMTARQGTEQHADRLTRLQMSFLWLGRDIEQAIDRSIRDEYGEAQAAIQSVEYGRYQLELTRAGWNNPAGRVRSNLQRVAYGVKDGELIRSYWPVLDRAQDSQPFESVLLDGVQRLELRFLDATNQWHDVWPDTVNIGQPTSGQPIAVEVTLETEAEGRMTRLFRVPSL